jgi:hypothetical protein
MELVKSIATCFEIINNDIKYKIEENKIHLDIDQTPEKQFILEINKKIINIKANTEYLTNHIERILSNKNLCSLKYEIINNDDIFIETISSLYDILKSPYLFCTICGNKLDFSVDMINNCDSCFHTFCQTAADNYVINSYNEDPTSFNFIVLTGITCLNSPKRDVILNPKPEKIANYDELLKQINVENIDDINKTIFMNDSDIKLKDKLGIDVYYFIKFLLKSNITRIRTSSFDGKKEMPTNLTNLNDILLISVSNPPSIEEEFDKAEPLFFFHGSAITNWYGILRNGLKNCSGTNMQSHGAAYGNGIYLSDNLAVSLSYTAGAIKGITTIGCAVVRVIGKADDYKKTPGIFVVPDEKKVLLKYIILANPSRMTHTYNYKKNDTTYKPGKVGELTSYFTKIRVEQISSASSLIPTVMVKRFKKEQEQFIKNGFECNMQDLKFILKKENLEIIIEYTAGYPISPPFVWISKGSIDSENISKHHAIITKELVPKYWTSNISLPKILSSIFNNVIIKKGENNNRDDAYNDYIKCFKSVG